MPGKNRKPDKLKTLKEIIKEIQIVNIVMSQVFMMTAKKLPLLFLLMECKQPIITLFAIFTPNLISCSLSTISELRETQTKIITG